MISGLTLRGDLDTIPPSWLVSMRLTGFGIKELCRYKLRTRRQQHQGKNLDQIERMCYTVHVGMNSAFVPISNH